MTRATLVNATIDDSSKIINYTGFATSGVQNKSIVPNDLVERSREKTLSFTATKSANATLYFTGEPKRRNPKMAPVD